MGKDESVSVWTDILIILVLSKFAMERFAGSAPLFGSFVVVALVFFLGLRFKFIQPILRAGLSIAAIIVFMIDIFYSKNPERMGKFLLLIVMMVGFYFVLRRFLRFLGFR